MTERLLVLLLLRTDHRRWSRSELEADLYDVDRDAIRRLLPRKAVAFVRVSEHPPAPFSQTWDPSHLGPFKQIIADTIEQPPIGAG